MLIIMEAVMIAIERMTVAMEKWVFVLRKAKAYALIAKASNFSTRMLEINNARPFED
jgi:hypothetical protein